MTAHALLSPSSASRWIACTPSARLESNFPDSTSQYAEEGSLAHAIGELELLYYSKKIKKGEYTKRISALKADPLYSEEMPEYIEIYTNLVKEIFSGAKKKTKDAIIEIEQKLDLTSYVPEGFGTGDCIIIADGTLHIIDLKYGKGVSVSAKENKQMMIYALGALEMFDFLYDINAVEMVICQPRLDNISSYTLSTNDLKAWADKILKPKAAEAYEGKGNYTAGDHCRFCKAKAVCKANAEYNLQIVNDYKLDDPALLSDSDISDILTKADSFKKWVAAIEEFALTEAVDNGKQWDGFKLVEGRSNRVYSDRDKVAETLLSNGIGEDLIYSKELLGITAMEKSITKKVFTDLLSDLIIKPQGKPTLVPNSDKREALNTIQNALDDFSNININN